MPHKNCFCTFGSDTMLVGMRNAGGYDIHLVRKKALCAWCKVRSCAKPIQGFAAHLVQGLAGVTGTTFTRACGNCDAPAAQPRWIRTQPQTPNNHRIRFWHLYVKKVLHYHTKLIQTKCFARGKLAWVKNDVLIMICQLIKFCIKQYLNYFPNKNPFLKANCSWAFLASELRIFFHRWKMSGRSQKLNV